MKGCILDEKRDKGGVHFEGMPNRSQVMFRLSAWGECLPPLLVNAAWRALKGRVPLDECRPHHIPSSRESMSKFGLT